MSLENFTYHYRLPPSATLVDLSEAYPEGGDLQFEIERTDFRIRIKCASEFTAIRSSYTALKALLDADPCDDVEFVINLSGSEVWAGQLNLRKAEWSPDTCIVRFTPDLEDDYTCLLESWEDEVNVIDTTEKVSVEPFFGTLDEQVCTLDFVSPVAVEGFAETNISSCLDDVTTYVIKTFTITDLGAGAAPNRYRHAVTWVSERATTACSGGSPVAPPGDGWTLVDNDCGGSGNATYGRQPQRSYDGEYSATSGLVFDNRYFIVGEDATAYDNGVLLSKILQDFADECTLTVRSDFFGIDPPGTAPANDAYTASSAVQSLVVFQKSDIKRPEDSNPATVGYLKLKDLLEYLRDIFNVYWRIEGGGAWLRIEHVSYFEGSNGDDLTAIQPEYVEDRNDFSFDADKLAPRDEYNWMDDTTDPDFRGRPIIYPTSCVDPSLANNRVNVKEIFTDLGKCIADADNVSDEGFFLMATDLIGGTYYLNKEFGQISGQLKSNAHLSWANLHEDYHTWGRPIASGTLNNVPQTFNSYKRSKRQQAVTVRYSQSAFFALDFAEKMKTELGWGEIDKATYSARGCLLTLEFLHDD